MLVMALVNGVAMYVAVVVKSNHPPTAPVPSSAVNEHQPSCFGLEEERGEVWKGSGATKPAITEVKSSL